MQCNLLFTVAQGGLFNNIEMTIISAKAVYNNP